VGWPIDCSSFVIKKKSVLKLTDGHANPLDSIVYKWDAVPHRKNLDMT